MNVPTLIGPLDILKYYIPGMSPESTESETAGDGIDDVDELNQDLIAASAAKFTKSNKAKTGHHWTKTMFINGWPEEPQDGFLHGAVNTPNYPSDITFHINPRDSRNAIEEMKEKVRDLDKKAELESDFLAAQERSREYQEANQMLQVLQESNTDLFEVSGYITARAETEETLDETVRDIQNKYESAPALLDLITTMFTQDKGLQSVSPVGVDVLGEQKEQRVQKMMGGAVASTLMWTSPTINEENGVEFGLQAHNGTPVIVDRFNRSNGYNQFTVGKIGSGKSFSTKLNLLRTYAQRDDVVIFIVDPLQGFEHIVRRFDGSHIVVGGNKAFNPMEIRPPSDDVPDDILEQTDALGQKIEGVLAFLSSYFNSRGHELGGRREILSAAIREAYTQKGITKDPKTHGKESPTLQDVIKILKQMAENPEKVAISESSIEVERIEQGAAELMEGMRPFARGRPMSHLGRHTEVDLDDDIVYFDLRQQEATGSPGLMMQLLFESVYQRAKETDKKVIFAIDEAHMILKDADSLDFLEQAVRHSRHYNLSINFITQTVDEFFEREKARTIAAQTAIKLLHRVEDLSEDSAKVLGLSNLERQYVKNAKTGKDSNYSEALLGVGSYGNIPLQVHALDAEAMIIDHEGYLEEEAPLLDEEEVEDAESLE